MADHNLLLILIVVHLTYLQKKKARSSVSKAKAKNNRLKSGNKKINVLGNAIIAQNWYAIRKKKIIPKANALTSPPI